MEAILDSPFRARIQFHGVLHGFFSVIGTGTVTVELKLSQYMASINQDLLFLVFLDLRNTYDMVYCGRLIKTLK